MGIKGWLTRKAISYEAKQATSLTEPTTLEDRITELISTLQGQRFVIGDKMVKISLSMAIKMSRRKAKDKKKHDRIISEHKLLQEFLKEIE